MPSFYLCAIDAISNPIYMKKKIEEALRTEFKELGLGDKTIGRLADYIVAKGAVTKEEDIATAVKGDDVKLIAKSIQGEIDGIQKAKQKAESDLADYKAKYPEKTEEEEKADKKDEQEKKQPDFMDALKAAVKEAVDPIRESFEAYKKQNSAKEAKTVAKDAFYANKWTTKFKEEADDAWDRAFELNEAKGGSMSADELSGKATEYFNKLVQRKGTDATKPFDAEKLKTEKFDFSEDAKALEASGKLEPQNK